ncbi:DNA-binding transcriptional regulator, ArsR family [Micromonospora marina]|uniref:DNA-binding transcriptional regulator, ArsR family n=1 Tax=Micromonospora marina TaxID=307120 RepID=A0A1C5A8U0_9ACTN|nr:DNA-binding transcriptional regulator, ArsR family [Micromonospora marina]
MIRLTVDDETLLGVRVAISPLWEALSSLALLARYRSEVPYPYSTWASTVRRALPVGFRRELLTWIAQLRSLRLPSFLTPVPASASPTIREELATLRATPAETVRRELEALYPTDVPAPLLRLADGADGLTHLTDLLGRYWDTAMAPYWRSMRNVLEEEILFRGRTLVTEGSDAMLQSLGGRVKWERPDLTLPYQTDINSTLRGTQFYVVPVLFARGMRIFSQGAAGSAISYQARGAAVLDGQVGDSAPPEAEPQQGDRLAILVGRGRAAVMRALVAPTTTTAVAGSVGLAPSTVSQHLTALSAAGMVRRRRAGSRVLYELDREGLALLSHLDCEISH